jgi:hypothetical protein
MIDAYPSGLLIRLTGCGTVPVPHIFRDERRSFGGVRVVDPFATPHRDPEEIPAALETD